MDKEYKLKFTNKKAKNKFVDLYEGKMQDINGVLENTALSDVYSKKKSVFILAKNKKAVRKVIEDAERVSSRFEDGYCFGVEDEDYKISKIER